MSQDRNWMVYLLECSDNTLYCGVTNNMERRLKAHNDGKGAKYTRSRLPVRLLACKSNMTRSEALRREYRVKQMPRRSKLEFMVFGCLPISRGDER